MSNDDNKFNFTKASLDSLPTPATGKRAYYYDTKLRGLGLSITDRGSKSFIVYRWVSGKPERITLGRYPDLTIEQARRKATEVNATIAQGENPNDKRRAERGEMTLKEFFDEFLERHSKLHKTSWKEDQAQFDRYLAPWSKRKLSNITKIDIQKLHQEIGADKGHYAANRLLALLSVMFVKANEFGLWNKENPAKGIKKFKEKSRERFLQAVELPRFFKALAEEPNGSIRDYIWISILTGVRRSNVLSMKWKDIYLEHNEWHIPHTKNGTPHIVTLVPEVVEILKQRQQQANDNIYVFPSTGKHGHLVEPKKGWQRIRERAKIDNIRIHDLRRTLGSWQARTGASLVMIGKSLNQKSIQATSIYARLDLDPVRASVERATSAILEAAGVKLKQSKEPVD